MTPTHFGRPSHCSAHRTGRATGALQSIATTPRSPHYHGMAFTPIMRPKLPSTERLAPYLKAIDASRIYSNFGPLAQSLEERLSEHYGLNSGTVATVANATLGLALALAIQQPPPGSLCVIPAWTFVASAHAALMAGLVPYFVDVDAETWAVDPNRLSDEITRAPASVGAVMPVMPFGSSLDIAAWEEFRARTGLAPVVDAAAAFDCLVPGRVPAVVSLHATKVLGIGEGGFVVSTDASIRDAVRMRSNFGFSGSREAQTAGFNAKLSEHQAAVGHAALDEWDQARAEWSDAASAYRRALAGSNRVFLQQGFGESWLSSTCVLAAGTRRRSMRNSPANDGKLPRPPHRLWSPPPRQTSQAGGSTKASYPWASRNAYATGRTCNLSRLSLVWSAVGSPATRITYALPNRVPSA